MSSIFTTIGDYFLYTPTIPLDEFLVDYGYENFYFRITKNRSVFDKVKMDCNLYKHITEFDGITKEVCIKTVQFNFEDLYKITKSGEGLFCFEPSVINLQEWLMSYLNEHKLKVEIMPYLNVKTKSNTDESLYYLTSDLHKKPIKVSTKKPPKTIIKSLEELAWLEDKGFSWWF